MRFIAIALLAAAMTVAGVPPPAGGGSGQPFLSATRDGVLLSWLEPAGGSGAVALRFARWRGGRWSAPRTIVARRDFIVNWADVPSIVEDTNGVLFAHWPRQDGIWMAVSRDDGRTWRTPFLLDGVKGERGFVSFAPLPKGGVGAVWLSEGAAMTLRYAEIDASGAIRSQARLDERVCDCCATGMTVARGRPVVVYRDRSPEEVRDVAVVRQTAGGWTAPRRLRDDGWKIAGCPVNGPQIDSRGDRVAAAWFTAAGEHPRAYVAFSDDAGATFAAPVAVDDGKPLGRVDVVLLDRDRAVVTWLEQTANGASLRARAVARSGKSEPSIEIARTRDIRGAGVARAAVVGRELFVAWTEAKHVRVARSTWP